MALAAKINKITFQEAGIRAQALCRKMTLDEKIDFIGGYKDFNIRPFKRLGIPEIRMADGPVGCRNFGKAVSFPSTILLAATFDRASARKFGATLGREARARGVHIQLAPAVNIHRGPPCGRNFEYMGEDPYLAAVMCVEYIRGLQAQGVMATVKHYACNNQDHDRHLTSSDLDERTLHEIYLPAFRAAVLKAGVKAVMTAYNPVNGVHCSENGYLINQVLKGHWGFKGIVMSDWDSVYSTEGPVNNGLDLEMPRAKFMNHDAIRPLIEKGLVKEETIDEKALRILRTCIEMGFYDRKQEDNKISWDDLGHNKIALDIARAGMVVCKNQRVLPFKKNVKRIAVLGPNAHPAVTGGGGSSFQEPFRSTSVLEGLQEAAPAGVQIIHINAPAALSHTQVADNTDFQTIDDKGRMVAGLKGEYFTNENLAEPAVATRLDLFVNFDWNNRPPFWSFSREHFSVRWTGFFTPAQSGEYEILTGADDGVRFYLNDECLIDDWSVHGVRDICARKRLEAGKRYNVKIEYFQNLLGASVYAGIRKVATALNLGPDIDAVVVCVGFNHQSELEGSDRSFVMPDGQEEIILLAAKAHPRVVVVLNAGGAVSTERWINKVSGFVHAFYGGQEGGRAVADILFGKVNPSGKLPFSFEKRPEDNASYGNYPGADKKMNYAEGVFLGYRHFDKKGIEPLFPFGHGLSYTTFKYGDLKIAVKKGAVAVSFTIKNTGLVAGAEISQVYVSDCKSSLPRPPKELKGFARVELKPGQKKNISVILDKEAFAFYDPQKHAWVVEPGAFLIQVGASSRAIKLKKALSLGGAF